MREITLLVTLMLVMVSWSVYAEKDQALMADLAPTYSQPVSGTEILEPLYLMWYDLPAGGTLCHFWEVNRRGFRRFPAGCVCGKGGFLEAFAQANGLECSLIPFEELWPQTLLVPAPEYIGQRQERAEWLAAVAERDRLLERVNWLERELGKFREPVENTKALSSVRSDPSGSVPTERSTWKEVWDLALGTLLILAVICGMVWVILRVRAEPGFHGPF